MNVESLVEQARRAAEKAYAPYSGFRVGAIVVVEDGSTYTGANVENSAYGSTICAEGSAISSAVAAGVRKIDTVVVACIDAHDVDGAYPCGNCRQLMNEFRVGTVVLTTGSGEVRTHSMPELLPYGFRLGE